MLDHLQKLFRKKTDSAPVDDHEEAEVQTAFAALLVEAASTDENYTASEKAIITNLLRSQFTITENEADALRQKGEAAQANAIDLHQFTREVKTLPEEDRIAFIEGLWRVVLSDGVRDPFEDALIRQLCNLIHLSDRTSGDARKRVEAQNAAEK